MPTPINDRLAAIEAKQDQILAMLDVLLDDALLHEEEPQEHVTLTDLDGNAYGALSDHA